MSLSVKQWVTCLCKYMAELEQNWKVMSQMLLRVNKTQKKKPPKKQEIVENHDQSCLDGTRFIKRESIPSRISLILSFFLLLWAHVYEGVSEERRRVCGCRMRWMRLKFLLYHWRNDDNWERQIWPTTTLYRHDFNIPTNMSFRFVLCFHMWSFFRIDWLV